MCNNYCNCNNNQDEDINQSTSVYDLIIYQMSIVA